MNTTTSISTTRPPGTASATDNDTNTNNDNDANTDTNTNTENRADPASPAAGHGAVGLRRLLLANAAFSALTGLFATIDAGPVADGLGIAQTWLVRATGVGLLGFAIVLLVLSRQSPDLVRRAAPLISVADFGWVLGTVVAVGFGWLSDSGSLAMGLVAVVVLAFGVGQLRLARSRAAS